MQDRTHVLELKSISKSFPGVKALKDVSVQVKRGEVRGLVGKNGAGKSTLMKILTGVYSKDEGSIFIDGKEAQIKSPLEAQRMGLSIIFQEFNLVNTLSIAENIFVGRLRRKGIFGVDWKTINEEAAVLLQKVGLNVNPETKVEELTVAGKQMVEIAKALSFRSKIIIMDEPSATLTTRELENLFSIIDNLKRQQITVIYISHRLEEIFKLCDNVTVLRDGAVIDTKCISELNREKIISLMIGRQMDKEYPVRKGTPSKDVILQVDKLCRASVISDVSFSLHRGEILGLAGLVGAGRTETVRAIFGADRLEKGRIIKNGRELRIKSPLDAISEGIALVTEDRKAQGLVLEETIAKNTSLASLKKVVKYFFIRKKIENKAAEEYMRTLKTKAPNAQSLTVNLSGGNQQKVVLARWLYRDTDILILDEPTRGIDVGAKYEIYQLIHQLVDAGKAVILISSEMPEVINLSDRILVMQEGRIKKELTGLEKTPEMVLQYAFAKREMGEEEENDGKK